MRRWYIGSAIVGSLALAAIVGPRLMSPAPRKRAGQPATQEPSKFAKSRIDKVTVYPNSALVTREVEVPAGNGLIELVVNPMPDRDRAEHDVLRGRRRPARPDHALQHPPGPGRHQRRTPQARSAKRRNCSVIGRKINSEIATVKKNMELLNQLENVTEKRQTHRRRGHHPEQIRHGATHRESQGTGRPQEQKRHNDVKLSFRRTQVGRTRPGSGRRNARPSSSSTAKKARAARFA